VHGAAQSEIPLEAVTGSSDFKEAKMKTKAAILTGVLLISGSLAVPTPGLTAGDKDHGKRAESRTGTIEMRATYREPGT